MSHFTVAVFTERGGRSVDELLAPYDENIKMDRYVAHTKAELIELGKKEIEDYKNGRYATYLTDPEKYIAECEDEAHIRYISKEFPLRLAWTDEEIYEDQIRYYDKEDIGDEGEVYSTYNPKSKWDWYQTGGRWCGMLKIKSGSVGGKGEASPLCDCVEYNDFDSARVRDIDFDAMREEELEELTPFEEMKKNSIYNQKYLNELYPTEEVYIKAVTEFSTFAVITPDGKWHERGTMGWFGCSSDTPDEGHEWMDSYYDAFIAPALENDWYITIIDCHI